MNKLFFLAFLLLTAGNLTAQSQTEKPEKQLITRPFQLSFITPLGTNGMESPRATNKLSINLMAGYAAGLDGVELGGFANVVRYQVKGVQMAGFLNYAGGETEGVQMAGFTNINAGQVDGLQMAGFANISQNHSGSQLAGFGNVVAQKVDGLQLAGFMNVAKETEGSQIAGFLNITGSLNGLQLGVVNVVDSVTAGTPVGVFNFVRKGYNHFEIWTTETMHLNAGLKFGTSKFYNILAVGAGYQTQFGDNKFGFAYGIGHAFRLHKGQMSLDALSYQLMDARKPFRFENREYNQLAQLKFSYDYPAKSVRLYIGPTFNALIQHNKQSAEEGWKSFAPYNFYSNTNGNTRIQLWAGAQAGIRF